jgi:dCMP deaminase
MPNLLNQWDERRLELAQLVATWSKDPKAQVDAVVSDRHGRVIALGYNGFAGGIEDSDDLLHNDGNCSPPSRAETSAMPADPAVGERVGWHGALEPSR